jgi:antitoxin MazE
MYIQEGRMKLAKWGNSLGVRIPAAIVQSENLKEGDLIEVRFRSGRVLEIAQDRSKEEALEEVRRMRRPLPSGFKFNREELHERGSYAEPLQKVS